MVMRFIATVVYPENLTGGIVKEPGRGELGTVTVYTPLMKFCCKKKGRNGSGIWVQERLERGEVKGRLYAERNDLVEKEKTDDAGTSMAPWRQGQRARECVTE